MIISDKYDGKNIIIYGLGKSGLSTYEALKETSAKLFLWDDDILVRDKLTKKGMNFLNLNDWPWEKMNFLIPSPGIQVSYKNKSPIIKKSLEINKIKIIGDFEIFFQNYKNNKSNDKIITVTGTNGKSTFVSILKDILEADGRNVSLAGNIGAPILSQKESNEERIYIFEVSSFQIELFNEFRSDIAVLLNISNDHADRYNSFDEYRDTKLKIFSNLESDDFAILNDSLCYKNSISKINPLPKKVIISNEDFFKNNLFDLPNFSYTDLIPSIFAVTDILNIRKDTVIRALLNFKNLEHRTNKIHSKDNIVFINDSKATNPAAANYAVSKFTDIYWILGGLSKSNDLSKLALDSNRIKKAFFIGSSAYELEKIAPNQLKYELSKDLECAIKSAYNDAKINKRGVILLSPGCSSLDQYKDYNERGEVFIKAVNNLVNEC